MFIKYALDHREGNLVHFFNDQDEDERYTFKSDIETLKNFGGGVYLFFDYSKKLAKVFTWISLVSVVKCYFLYQANGFNKSSTQAPAYLQFSLGNLYKSDYVPEKYLFFVLDCLPSLILLIFLIWYKFRIWSVQYDLD